MNQPWYYRSWFILPLMFFCFPIGIAFMWAGKKYPLWARFTITAFFALIFLAVLNSESPKKEGERKTVTPQPNIEEVISEPIQDFTPVYTIIEENDFSYLGVIRKGLRIKLPLGLTKVEVQKNIAAVIANYISDKQNIAALSVFAYRPDDLVNQAYTIAMGEFAPGGVWGDADKFTSYKDNELIIKFAEPYFNPSNDPLDFLNPGDEVILKKTSKISDNPSQWFDENVIVETIQDSRVKIIDKQVFPMGSLGDLIRYKIKTNTHSGWVFKEDLNLK